MPTAVLLNIRVFWVTTLPRLYIVIGVSGNFLHTECLAVQEIVK
jgi:hypothetical protein